MNLKGLLVAGQYFWLLDNTFVSTGNTFWAGQYFWSSVKPGSRPFSLKLVAVIASPTIMEWVRDKKWNRAIIALVISPSKKVGPWLGEWGGALLMSDHLPFRIPKTISASSCTQILSVSWNVFSFSKWFQRTFLIKFSMLSQNNLPFLHHFLPWDLLKGSLGWINKALMESKCFAKEEEEERPNITWEGVCLPQPSDSKWEAGHWPNHLVTRRQMVSPKYWQGWTPFFGRH